MKKMLSLLALGLSLSLGAAHAADEKAKTPQQTKMGTCNAEAKGLKGEEFKKKRDDCLKNKPETVAPAAEGKTAQQTKMKTCNAEAKGLKGEEFKKKRNECLKAK